MRKRISVVFFFGFFWRDRGTIILEQKVSLVDI